MMNEENGDVVYRVQDKEGRGPFRPGFSKRWVESRLDHLRLKPWTVEFGILDRSIFLPGEHVVCACKTIEQLQRWFIKKEYETLKKFGYTAVKIRVNRIIAESNIQCVVGRVKPFFEGDEPVRLY